MGSLIDMPVSLCYPQYLSSVIQRSPPHQVSRDIVEPDIDGLRVLNSVADSVLMSQGAASSLCSIYTVVCKKTYPSPHIFITVGTGGARADEGTLIDHVVSLFANLKSVSVRVCGYTSQAALVILLVVCAI